MCQMFTKLTTLPHLAVAASLALLGCVDEVAPLEDGDLEPAESVATSELEGVTWVHRAFKSLTGEHFYSSNPNEFFPNGYQIESYYYYSLATLDPGAGWEPFYRCYWSNARKHFYTLSANCEGVAWNEGVLGHIATVQVAGTTPLHRLYQSSNNDHLYTTSHSEFFFALSLGYTYEGISGYVYPKP